jgi:hypothetical protein
MTSTNPSLPGSVEVSFDKIVEIKGSFTEHRDRLMVVENMTALSGPERFVALVKYCSLPQPSFVIMGETPEDPMSMADYFGGYLVPRDQEEDLSGCRVIVEGDTLLLYMHGPDCGRTMTIADALVEGKPPQDFGHCPLTIAMNNASSIGVPCVDISRPGFLDD